MIYLVQISDLHFGTIFSNAKQSWISGFNKHDYRLCEALIQFLKEDIAETESIGDEEMPFLVMNGDLTGSGTEGEFETANTYLFSQHALITKQRGQQVGLNWEDVDRHGKDLYAGIPGNHDHGYWLCPVFRGFDANVYNHFHCTPPFVKRIWCSDGIELCVFGLESCSIFKDLPPNINLLAEGGFSVAEQDAFVRFLESELSKPLIEGCQYRTAMIVCHHPFARDGDAGPLFSESAEWLAGVAADFGIRLILTGHTHRTWTTRIDVATQSGNRTVREVRCPTTLQTPAELNPKYRSPGLWLHKVSLENDRIAWEGKLLLYTGTSFAIPESDESLDREERLGWFKEFVDNV